MARTALTSQVITRDGLNPTYEAANVDGHSWANNGTQVLHVKNDDAANITVSFPITVTVDGESVADKSVTVSAGAEAMFGPFPGQYTRSADGAAWVNFSAVANVSVALLQFNPVR